jgi:hypothetical protein
MRNGEYVEEERRVCGGGTESMWRRNGEYVDEERRVCGGEERRVCGGGTERCGGRNGEYVEEERRVYGGSNGKEQRYVVKGTESVRRRNREMWWKERRDVEE